MSFIVVYTCDGIQSKHVWPLRFWCQCWLWDQQAGRVGLGAGCFTSTAGRLVYRMPLLRSSFPPHTCFAQILSALSPYLSFLQNGRPIRPLRWLSLKGPVSNLLHGCIRNQRMLRRTLQLVDVLASTNQTRGAFITRYLNRIL